MFWTGSGHYNPRVSSKHRQARQTNCLTSLLLWVESSNQSARLGCVYTIPLDCRGSGRSGSGDFGKPEASRWRERNGFFLTTRDVFNKLAIAICNFVPVEIHHDRPSTRMPGLSAMFNWVWGGYQYIQDNNVRLYNGGMKCCGFQPVGSICE